MEGNRLDVAVYNEATKFVLISQSRCGHHPDWFSKQENMTAAITNGILIPTGLAQDDAFTVRLVLGELSAQEEDEWLARFCLETEGSVRGSGDFSGGRFRGRGRGGRL